MIEAVRERGLEVDILINNAGSAGPDLIDDKDWQRSHDYLELMMMSVAAMCHFFIPPMLERGFGHLFAQPRRTRDGTLPGLYAHGFSRVRETHSHEEQHTRVYLV